jgi:hypothetical protein
VPQPTDVQLSAHHKRKWHECDIQYSFTCYLSAPEHKKKIIRKTRRRKEEIRQEREDERKDINKEGVTLYFKHIYLHSEARRNDELIITKKKKLLPSPRNTQYLVKPKVAAHSLPLLLRT